MDQVERDRVHRPLAFDKVSERAFAEMTWIFKLKKKMFALLYQMFTFVKKTRQIQS